MNIPSKFEYKGKIWKVKHRKTLEKREKCVGLCDFDARTIYLQTGLNEKKQSEVFLHELFHVVVFEAHINQNVRFSEGLEEVLCDAFSDLMVTLFESPRWKNVK